MPRGKDTRGRKEFGRGGGREREVHCWVQNSKVSMAGLEVIGQYNLSSQHYVRLRIVQFKERFHSTIGETYTRSVKVLKQRWDCLIPPKPRPESLARGRASAHAIAVVTTGSLQQPFPCVGHTQLRPFKDGRNYPRGTAESPVVLLEAVNRRRGLDDAMEGLYLPRTCAGILVL